MMAEDQRPADDWANMCLEGQSQSLMRHPGSYYKYARFSADWGKIDQTLPSIHQPGPVGANCGFDFRPTMKLN
ncbi:hypothetical protein I7I50_03476 [Histoplasma capsulatum G186AR]|uniref:Uncharacterized protein n=1 Tax=Ajellomyces capsulatus TaxID=5037 RepID=A0A8H8CXA9_AJECA|nr:hypothetical protein I7I52_04383 [Histoplasma capsulatum]QSS74613.1 hypothetical protein I7I50_03476 [Histoplasma capsulatum G186AR]